MSPGWEDLIARVRGLTSHLVGRERLIELARSSDLVHMVTLLEEAYGKSLGVAPGSAPPQAELAVRRAAAAHLATLARWSLDRSKLLTPFFLDEDRRSVRALLRGAAAGAPAEERLVGLVPTPALPERALRELASQRSVADIATQLSAWSHPFGSRLLALAREHKPDMLRLDLLLNDIYISESAAAIRHAPRGHATRRELATYVSDIADIENAMTALQLAGQRITIAPGEFFLPQGRHLDLEVFVAIAESPDVAAGRALVQHAFRATPFASAFSGSPRDIEDGILTLRLRDAVRNALLHPLGAAPVIAFVLRLRAEVRDLCLILWRIAAGAPQPTTREIVSVT